MKFKLIYNSNFPAHRWRCKHLKYLDRLDVLTETLTEIYRYSHKRFCSELFNIRDFGMPTRQHQKD